MSGAGVGWGGVVGWNTICMTHKMGLWDYFHHIVKCYVVLIHIKNPNMWSGLPSDGVYLACCPNTVTHQSST